MVPLLDPRRLLLLLLLLVVMLLLLGVLLLLVLFLSSEGGDGSRRGDELPRRSDPIVQVLGLVVFIVPVPVRRHGRLGGARRRRLAEFAFMCGRG